jgi:hypothetical protein|nr:MAG TPA: hypothetical protein [Caudoviricetes sp.]
MASIETYRTRIDALKTSIETLKSGGPLIIQNLPGRAPLVVHEWDDYNFPLGTVITGDADHVYLRVPHGGTFWVSSIRDVTKPRRLGRNELYNHLRELAAAGEQFRIVHWPSR